MVKTENLRLHSVEAVPFPPVLLWCEQSLSHSVEAVTSPFVLVWCEQPPSHSVDAVPSLAEVE